MKHAINELLRDFYLGSSGARLMKDIAQIACSSLPTQNGKGLVCGSNFGYLDCLELPDIYFAIPNNFIIEHWPKMRPFKTVIVDTQSLPFLPYTFDYVLLIHVLELISLSSIQDLMTEINRVMKKTGRVVVILKSKSLKDFVLHGVKKNIKNSFSAILNEIINAEFKCVSIVGKNINKRILSYEFSYNINKYNEFFIKYFPLFSDILVFTFEKYIYSCDELKVFRESLDYI